jgi:hypothetical protein
MPFSKQLHGMFTPQQLKNIVFLYISIDGSEDAWKAAVNQLGIEGKLAYITRQLAVGDREILPDIQHPAIHADRYQGNIVNLNAKRPSSGQQIYNDIIHLLN